MRNAQMDMPRRSSEKRRNRYQADRRRRSSQGEGALLPGKIPSAYRRGAEPFGRFQRGTSLQELEREFTPASMTDIEPSRIYSREGRKKEASAAQKGLLKDTVVVREKSLEGS